MSYLVENLKVVFVIAVDTTKAIDIGQCHGNRSVYIYERAYRCERKKFRVG